MLFGLKVFSCRVEIWGGKKMFRKIKNILKKYSKKFFYAKNLNFFGWLTIQEN